MFDVLVTGMNKKGLEKKRSTFSSYKNNNHLTLHGKETFAQNTLNVTQSLKKVIRKLVWQIKVKYVFVWMLNMEGHVHFPTYIASKSQS